MNWKKININSVNFLPQNLTLKVQIGHFKKKNLPLIPGQKSCLLGPTVFEIPQLNWYQCVSDLDSIEITPLIFTNNLKGLLLLEFNNVLFLCLFKVHELPTSPIGLNILIGIFWFLIPSITLLYHYLLDIAQWTCNLGLVKRRFLMSFQLQLFSAILQYIHYSCWKSLSGMNLL